MWKFGAALAWHGPSSKRPSRSSNNMELKRHPALDITAELLEAIRSFPARREVEHCGVRIGVDPFEYYAQCPQCGSRFKVRSFSAQSEIEDIFDAVFEWLSHPGAQEVARRRQEAIAAEDGE
jgi:hypothetical protein